MTDPTPLVPALHHLQAEAQMYEALSAFQQQSDHHQPVRPSLPAVLAAATPAFQAGFSYTASHWGGELCVTLHYRGAELGSSCPAGISNYSEACARLLAGLLGIPVLELDHSSEPEPAPVVISLPVQQQPMTEPAAELTAEADAETPAAAQPGLDICRSLTEEEKATAIAMVKAMSPDQRRAFTKAFREEFEVPPDAKQISPFIQELRHLHFCDRYTVEAAGGIAA